MGKRGKKPRDLTGLRSGKLIVEEMVFHNGLTRCRCKCDCGNESIMNSFQISSKRCVSCGCDRAKRGNRSGVWTGCGKISGTFWNRVCNNAEQSNKVTEFTITIQDAWGLFKNQKGKCALSGIDLELSNSRKDYKCTASLDRIDSNKGYVKGNVQWVHKVINKMKSDLLQDEFVSFCKLVTENGNSGIA